VCDAGAEVPRAMRSCVDDDRGRNHAVTRKSRIRFQTVLQRQAIVVAAKAGGALRRRGTWVARLLREIEKLDDQRFALL